MQRSIPTLAVMRIIWAALLMTCFIHAGIAFSGIFPAQHELSMPILPYLFGGLAVVLSVMSFVMPRAMYVGAARAATLSIREEAAPEAFAGRYRDAMEKRRVFADLASARDYAFGVFMTRLILSCALSEAIALFGLVLAMQGFGPLVSAPFFVGGAALIAARFPREEQILDAFERAQGAAFPVRS